MGKAEAMLKEVADKFSKLAVNTEHLRREDEEVLSLAKQNNRSLAIIKQGRCWVCRDILDSDLCEAVKIDGELPLVYVCSSCFAKGLE